MFSDLFSTVINAITSIPLAIVPAGVSFWLQRLGIDLVFAGFISGLVASIAVMGVRTAINLFTLGAARL